MQKTNKSHFPKYFPYIHILLLYCTTHQSIAFAHTPSYEYECEEKEEAPTNYEEFGDFADVVRIVEDEIAAQEEIDEKEAAEKGLFSKWTKNLKRWFVKRVKNIFKKCVKMKKRKSPEECAYSAAKFKRKIDHVFNTGSIDSIFADVDKNLPEAKKASFEQFKKRINFYHRHKHAKPSQEYCLSPYDYVAKGDKKNQLEDIPFGAVIGGVEIFCGCLIGVLPFPGCRQLGIFIAGDGATRIVSAYIDKHDKEDKDSGKKDSEKESKSVLELEAY